MSKWLSSVNTLLEKLDDTAEAVAEERRATGEEDPLAPAPEIEEILAKRGLARDSAAIQAQQSHSDDVDAIDLEDLGELDGPAKNAERVQEPGESKSNENMATPTDKNPNPEGDEPNPKSNEGERKRKGIVATPAEEEEKGGALAPKNLETQHDTTTVGIVESGESSSPAIKVPAIVPKLTPAKAATSGKEKELVLEAKEAQKEARTLRRHVVSLNSQLESAEIELQAQRNELERAAEQMEKDRIRTKDAKEATKKVHTKELEALRSQHDKALKEQLTRFEKQVESYRNKLTDMESQKKQEDGDWSKEMTNVMEREKELSQQVMSMEYVFQVLA